MASKEGSEDTLDARAQLAELDAAVRVVRHDGALPSPKWLFPIYGLAGPGVVAWRYASGEMSGSSTAQNLVYALAVLLVVVAAIALVAGALVERRERRSIPDRSSTRSIWLFLGVLATTFGLSLAFNTDVAEPFGPAILTWVVMGLLSAVAFAQHVRTLRARGG